MKKEYIILFLIVTLGFFVRVWNLGKNPYGFFCDEASIGYNSYSLLTSGKDEYGARLPIFYRAFGEYKNPIMLYSTMPSVFIFGLNEFSVRIVSVFYGVLGIAVIYLLGTIIFSNRIGLVSALLLAISPWHIHFSRVSLEGLAPFVFFTTLGTYFWYKHWVTKTSWFNFFLSVLLFALAFYSYFPARIFIPLFTLSLCVLEIKDLFKDLKKIVVGIVFTGILIIPMLIHVFFGPGMSRWNQVISNKPIIEVARLYIAHFSLDFLFIKGDIDFPGQFITRHSIRGMAELYFFQLPLIIFGFYHLIKKKKKGGLVLAMWLLFYPLGSSLTNVSGPQATRSIIGIIPFQIISALGLISIYDLIKNKIVIKKFIFFPLTALVILVPFFNFLTLLNKYPLYSSDFWGWQYGPRDIMKYFFLVKDKYDDLYIVGNFNAPEIFIKFYDPKNTCNNKCMIGSLDKFQPNRRQFYAVGNDRISELNSKRLKIETKYKVFYPNGQVAFNIGEITR